MIRAVFAGEPGPRRDAILLNAAGAIAAAGHAADLARASRARARPSIPAPRRTVWTSWSRSRARRGSPSGTLSRTHSRRPAWARSPRSSGARPRRATSGRTRTARARRRVRAAPAPPPSRCSWTSASAGSVDDLRAARVVDGAAAAGQGLLSAEEAARALREAGADAVLLLLRDLDDEEVHAPHGVAPPSSGSTPSSRRTTPEELERAVRLGADPIGVNARDLATFAHRPARAARAGRARAARPGRGRRERDRVARAGGRRRARRRGRDPRRLDADARPRSRREARGADLAAARQGLRPDARGGRRRRRRGGRRPGRLHPGAGEPAPRRRSSRPSPTRCCRSPSSSARQARRAADLVQLYAREDGHRGRDAVLLRDGERGRHGRRPALGSSEDPTHLERARSDRRAA